MKGELRNWKDLPIGGLILKPGSAEEFQTGDWRSDRPVWDEARCINCLSCWIYCPDSAIFVKDGKFRGFDLRFCKGCGICVKVCPPKAQAIKMVSEKERR